MTALTIHLPEERWEQLRQLAERAGVTLEELVRANLEDWLQRPGEDFVDAARYVFQKNARLYRRLA